MRKYGKTDSKLSLSIEKILEYERIPKRMCLSTAEIVMHNEKNNVIAPNRYTHQFADKFTLVK